MNTMNSYETLVKVLSAIEKKKFDKLTADALAGEVYLSASHLQKLFKLTCGQSLMSYVRGRKLASSLDELLNSRMRVIDIALHYGFQHEQSYIRAFSKEYGCTPGEARDAKLILPIRERIAPEELQNLGQGFLYGPQIVKIPSFHLVGKTYAFRGFDSIRDAYEPNKVGLEFYFDAVKSIPNTVCSEVYVAICLQMPEGWGNIEYMPCLEVKDLSRVPDGFEGKTIPPMLCARFRYIGSHPCEEINMMTAREIYNAKQEFFRKQTRYIEDKRIRHLERVDTRLYDGLYCQMELIAPVEDTLR